MAVGGGDVTVQAIGAPTGGVYTFGGINPGTTGGTFTLVDPVNGTFTFTSPDNSGTAAIDIIYTPPSNISLPVTETYTINVSNIISVDPASPVGVEVGSPPLTITAMGDPVGGTFALGNINGGLTGGTFALLDEDAGTFEFRDTTSTGQATAEILYTPPTGAVASFLYIIDVSSLSFSVSNPAGFIVGASDLAITAVASPAGGLISLGNIDIGTTGGNFTIINATTGEFTFGGANSIGTASTDVIYTPGGGAPISVTFEVDVFNIVFPAVSTGLAPSGGVNKVGFVLGDPTATFTGDATPSGGTFSIGSTDTSATGGFFTILDQTTASGITTVTFSYGGAVSPGDAIIELLYTVDGVTGAIPFSVCVVGFTFIPSYPGTNFFGLETGSDPLTITAIGNPPGGTFELTGFDPGSTGGSFSPVGLLDPISNTFVFSGSSGAGTAVADIRYTLPTNGIVIETTYTMETVSLVFSPASPLEIAVGGTPVTIDAIGIRSGGIYTATGAVDNGTSGSFSAIDPITGEFTFDGALSAGSASLDVTYTSLAGTAVTKTYTVIVSSLAFSPPSPLSVLATPAGSAPVTVTVIGGDDGGTISIITQSGGGTGGVFAVTGASTFSFSGATTGGTATADILYTPPIGATVLMTYTVNVTSLTFSPPSPAGVAVGDVLFVTATGLPPGGTYSGGGATDLVTGGSFSTIDSVGGTFTFSGAIATGTATTSFTFTPVVGASITLSYSVIVTSLDFAPASPIALTTSDSPVLVTAIGGPSGGTYTGSFSAGSIVGLAAPSIGLVSGTFTVDPSTVTTGGTATYDVTYTPALPAVPITASYVIHVTHLTFSPASTSGVTVGSTLTVTVTGTPAGGSFSGGGFTDPVTTGVFSTVSGSTFTFSGATESGAASADFTYDPGSPFVPLTLTYTVVVTNLRFSPASPLALTTSDSPTLVTAIGEPAGGTYTGSFSAGSITGLAAPTIDSLLGTFVVDPSTVTTGGTASYTVTYTPDLPAVAITSSYTINVTHFTFSPASPAGVITGATLTVSVTGTPTGGVFSGGAVTDLVTGGEFSAISGGSFTFSGASESGIATTDYTYDPGAPFVPLTLSYSVFVTSLEFSPESPLALTTSDSPALVTAIGEPVGGTYAGTFAAGSITGLAAPSIDSVSGTFTVDPSTVTVGGTATYTVTYTPDLPAVPISAAFEINVTHFTFSPASPAGVVTGGTLTVTVTGTPTGGVFSGGGVSDAVTGGDFSTVTGTSFTFSGAVATGTASTDYTYDPGSPFVPLTLTYTVVVTSLEFSPVSSTCSDHF